MSARGLAHYARAVERELERALGRPRVLSPGDFALLAAWHARGIPAGLIVECLRERLAERPGRPPRSLRPIASRVEEAWEAMRAGRLPGTPAGIAGVEAGARARWRRAAERAETDSLRRLLHTLLEAVERGEAPEEIERTLEAELPRHVSDERRERLRETLERELARYRGRMRETTFRRTLERALVAALRRELDLPPLG